MGNWLALFDGQPCYHLEINDSSVKLDALNFTGNEALSEPFQWGIDFTTPQNNLAPEQVLMKYATLRMRSGKAVHDIITRLEWITLAARATGAARAVLERFGIARDFDMDDERQSRQVDPARRDVGRDADTGAAVTQRLQRMVTLILRMLTRQRHGREAALDQTGVQVADIVAGRAEQDRNLGLVQAQQVDHRRLDIGGGDRHHLIGDVGMALILADRLDPLGIGLVALGELHDRARHGRREQERAALGRRL